MAADSLREAAHITFLFPTRPAWDMTVAVFTAGTWSGEPAETDEIRPEWFPVAALPLDRMWDDGKRWVPRVLAGERLRATFSYAPDCETVAESSIALARLAGRQERLAQTGHLHEPGQPRARRGHPERAVGLLRVMGHAHQRVQTPGVAEAHPGQADDDRSAEVVDNLA